MRRPRLEFATCAMLVFVAACGGGGEGPGTSDALAVYTITGPLQTDRPTTFEIAGTRLDTLALEDASLSYLLQATAGSRPQETLSFEALLWSLSKTLFDGGMPSPGSPVTTTIDNR